MKDNTKEVLITLIWAVAITSVICGLYLTMAWVYSPTAWTFRIEMDNNTKEAIQSINYTQTNEDPEWMHYAPAMNFSCFGMQCSPTESVYIKGIGVCYNKSEGIICPV